MSRFNYSALAQDLSVLVGRSVTEEEARAVKRDLQRHQSIQERHCSEDMNAWTWDRVAARERGVERRLREFFGDRLKGFSGDPRGATVKLIDPREHGMFPVGYSFTCFSRDWGGHLIFTEYRR